MVAGAYCGMTSSCCGAIFAQAIGMVLPAFIKVKTSLKNRPKPSPPSIGNSEPQAGIPRTRTLMRHRNMLTGIIGCDHY